MFVPSEYTKHFDPTGNATPVPDAVLIVNVRLLDPLVVASSTIKLSQHHQAL